MEISRSESSGDVSMLDQGLVFTTPAPVKIPGLPQINTKVQVVSRWVPPTPLDKEWPTLPSQVNSVCATPSNGTLACAAAAQAKDVYDFPASYTPRTPLSSPRLATTDKNGTWIPTHYTLEEHKQRYEQLEKHKAKREQFRARMRLKFESEEN